MKTKMLYDDDTTINFLWVAIISWKAHNVFAQQAINYKRENLKLDYKSEKPIKRKKENQDTYLKNV